MSSLDAEFTDLVGKLSASLVTIQSKRFGAGAGVIWDAGGMILTNFHVLGNHTPRITLADDRSYEAEVAYSDPEIDLALLRIPATKLPAAPIGDSTLLRTGELVFTLGHPWGQRAATSLGIVSHLTTAQTRQSGRVIPVIRIDAHLAPGNSGGPLLNGAGEVVGINTLIVGGDQGVAIPSAVARDFVAKQEQPANQTAFS
jgi:serine protease Do